MPPENSHQIVISVFGGSSPKPGSAAYQKAVQLGTQLAHHGFSVQTGGYIGTMEAISRGAAKAGGHVIGVTCDEIERWRPVLPNRWVKEEHRFPTLRERLFYLIDHCDAAIALPGGIGTLAEISLMWTELQIQSITSRPFYLIGSGWETTLKFLFSTQSAYIPASETEKLLFFPNLEDVVQDLIKRFRNKP